VRLQLPPAPPTFASWCNSSMPGFDPVGLGANPSEAANPQPVSSKSELQSYKLMTLENCQHGLPLKIGGLEPSWATIASWRNQERAGL
jgi:hypothetical protein